MAGLLLGYGFALLTAVIVLGGDFLIKIAADGRMSLLSTYVLGGCLLYGASAVMWYFSMRHATLAQAGVAYSMLTLLALCLIGVVYFDERIYTREVLGIGCALAAMVLMVRIA
ncbi:MAG: hypothetical protein AAFV87_03955 [Pseudomonadota bacterium]